jgi:DNA-binding GntR family transcriptional regulator
MADAEEDTYSHLGMDQLVAPTLVDTAADALRTWIFAGKFAPGERLYEAALARQFGMSRGPLREALALLEGDGLVENVPRRGKFVTNPDARTIDEIYSLRRLVEPYAAELVIEKLDGSGESVLMQAVANLTAAVNGGEAVEVARCDIDFHAHIYALAGHDPLERTWREIIANKLRLLVNDTTKTHDIADPGPNHQLIVDAILARDVDKTRLLLVDHIDDGWTRARALRTGATPS